MIVVPLESQERKEGVNIDIRGDDDQDDGQDNSQDNGQDDGEGWFTQEEVNYTNGTSKDVSEAFRVVEEITSCRDGMGHIMAYVPGQWTKCCEIAVQNLSENEKVNCEKL